MSEKKANLTDFFNKASKKKPAPKAAKEAPAGGEPDSQEHKPAKDPAVAQQKKTTDYESSDDEKPDLIITNDDSLLLDKKEAEAKRSKQQAQTDSVAGWRALDAASGDKPAGSLNAEPSGPPKGVSAAAKSNTIEFKSGAPMKFTNKKKKIDEEFPELGE